jgi:hypothetical protein
MDLLTGTLRQGARWGRGGYIAGRREMIAGCASARAHTCSPTALPPLDRGRELARTRSHSSGRWERCARRLLTTRSYFRAGMSAGLQAGARRAPDHSGDARRCVARGRMAERLSRSWHLRHRLLLPRGTQGPGAHPHPDLAAPHERPDRPRHRTPSRRSARSSGVIPTGVKGAGQGKAEAWHLAAGRAGAQRSDPTTCAHQGAKAAICGTDMHIYNWDEWAQKTIPVPMAVGHEYARARSLRDRLGGDRLRGGRARSGRGAHHLWPLPQLPRRAAAPVPQHRGRRRESPGALPSTSRLPAGNAFKVPEGYPMTSPPSSTRSATPSTPRSPSTWWAKMCSSPAPVPSAAWPPRSPATSARVTS